MEDIILKIVFRSDVQAMKEYFTDKINEYLRLREIAMSDEEIDTLLDNVANAYANDDEWGK